MKEYDISYEVLELIVQSHLKLHTEKSEMITMMVTKSLTVLNPH